MKYFRFKKRLLKSARDYIFGRFFYGQSSLIPPVGQ
jgi:hypothetical protein